MTDKPIDEYEIINFEDKPIALDHPIAKVRFGYLSGWSSSRYVHYSCSLLPVNARKALREANLIRIRDLEWQSITTLVALKGIGNETAKKIIRLAKKCGVKIRGTGFPWEMKPLVIVPNDTVDYVRELGKTDSEELLGRYISDQFFTSIESAVHEARQAKLQEEKEAIEQRLQFISAELEELEE